jgi:L,D-transpeptidase catalytic domain
MAGRACCSPGNPSDPTNEARTITTALLTAMLSAGALAGAPPAGAPPGTPLVALRSDHVVRAAPGARARRIGHVAARRPLTRVRTVLPVVARSGRWVRVRLPGRPNGHAGWIHADGTRRTSTHWRITVRLAKRLVTVYHRGRLRGRFRTVIGRPDAPTPRGRSFVEEILPVSGIGRPYALALSSRSAVYQEFAGGPGQVAFHGTTGIPGALGTAVSHGCLRLSPRAMRWLARRVRPGVPVTVRP